MNPPLKPSLRHYLKAMSPSYWLMAYPYSDEWDRKLRSLMANNTFLGPSIHFDKFVALIGDELAWKANHPYASFRPYCDKESILPRGIRPSRATIALAHEKMLKDLYGT